MTSWDKPAMGTVLGKLVELALRAERVRAARSARANAKVLELASRKAAK